MVTTTQFLFMQGYMPVGAVRALRIEALSGELAALAAETDDKIIAVSGHFHGLSHDLRQLAFVSWKYSHTCKLEFEPATPVTYMDLPEGAATRLENWFDGVLAKKTEKRLNA